MKIKSTVVLTILVTGAALLSGLCADELTVIPPDHKKEADKTYAAGTHYYIWPATTNTPITSSKVAFLPGRDTPALLISICFKAKDDVPESFCMRIKLFSKDSDSPSETMTMGDDSTKGKASGRTLGMIFIPALQNVIGGAAVHGRATIHLVKKSDEKIPDAKPISNEITLKTVIEP